MALESLRVTIYMQRYSLLGAIYAICFKRDGFSDFEQIIWSMDRFSNLLHYIFRFNHDYVLLHDGHYLR